MLLKKITLMTVRRKCKGKGVGVQTNNHGCHFSGVDNLWIAVHLLTTSSTVCHSWNNHLIIQETKWQRFTFYIPGISSCRRMMIKMLSKLWLLLIHKTPSLQQQALLAGEQHEDNKTHKNLMKVCACITLALIQVKTKSTAGHVLLITTGATKPIRISINSFSSLWNREIFSAGCDMVINHHLQHQPKKVANHRESFNVMNKNAIKTFLLHNEYINVVELKSLCVCVLINY